MRHPYKVEMIGRTVIQVASGFSSSRLSGVSDYQPKWVARLTMSDHGDLRSDLGNNREREKTKSDACKQWEELHTDHRIILHAPHERDSASHSTSSPVRCGRTVGPGPAASGNHSRPRPAI